MQDPRRRAAESGCEVIVLGTGPGGMAATAAAVHAGATVTVVEPEQRIGGNAIYSTGYLAFVRSAAQEQQGIHDSEDAFVDDALRMAELAGEDYGILCDESLVRLFARESAATYRQLVEGGVRFARFIPRPRQHTTDRMLAVEDPTTLARPFEPVFADPRVTTLFGTVGERLIVEGGRVAGVIARPRTGSALAGDERYGEPMELRARHGVVLATGGYQANPALRRRYQPGYLAAGPYLGIDSCRGDGHLMGQAVGGDLINMTYVPPLVMVGSALVEDTIAVNRDGVRFHDEAGPYEERVRALLAQPDRAGWYLFDAVTAGGKAHLIDQMPEPPVTAPTVRELAAAVGCAPGILEESVREWNAMLATGTDRDPAFGRVVLPAGHRPLAVAPFSAVPMVVGVNFVSGGFSVTEDLQVIDVFGSPIRGLFAAGDCVGGFNPTADLGGIRIAGGFTLGRLAGDAAARGVHGTGRYPTAQHRVRPSTVHREVEIVHVTGQAR